MKFLIGRCCRPWFGFDKRGSVAIWIAMLTPGLLMVTAMGVEVGSWAAAQVGVQRAADMAAVAGAINYRLTSDKQKAATFAARMAQLNGGVGTAAPHWDGVSKLTDNAITVAYVTGLQTGSNPAFAVTVQRTINAGVSAAFSSTPNYTVSATGTAELVANTTPFPGDGNGFPCLLALSGTGTISGQGSTYWTMPNCTVRSNNTVDVHGGGGPLTTGGIYAVNAVNIDNWIATPPSAGQAQHPNSPVAADPFAGYAVLQNALTNAGQLTGVTDISCGTTTGSGSAGANTGNNNCNGTNTLPNQGTCVTNGGVTCTMYPGNYGSWLVPSGGPYTFNLQPGLYLFNGPVLLQQNTTTSGSGVTIIMAGGTYNGTARSFVGSNTFNFTVSAPTGAQVAAAGGNGTKNAGIAGIALASNSSTTAVLSGNEAFVVSGVVYFPNATWDASGSSCNSSSQCMAPGSTACLELVAQSIKTSGYVTFNSNCSSYGLSTLTAVVTH
jgi:Flp pilus assembly protein TadG